MLLAQQRLSQQGEIMFKCPYCSKNTFTSWKSVRGHITSCSNKTGEYYISMIYGPIHYTVFIDKTYKEIKQLYPEIHTLSTIMDGLSIRGINIDYIRQQCWSKDNILTKLKEFTLSNNRSPIALDFSNDINYPSHQTVVNHFGSWNQALLEAGLEININSGFGIPTIAKDNIKYRSKAEAYFVDNYLYNKYLYIYEPKYTDGSKKLYDFYLPELDLYIELTDGLQPERIQEKILINKEQNKNLLVLTVDDMYNNKILLP